MNTKIVNRLHPEGCSNVSLGDPVHEEGCLVARNPTYCFVAVCATTQFQGSRSSTIVANRVEVHSCPILFATKRPRDAYEATWTASNESNQQDRSARDCKVEHGASTESPLTHRGALHPALFLAVDLRPFHAAPAPKGSRGHMVEHDGVTIHQGCGLMCDV